MKSHFLLVSGLKWDPNFKESLHKLQSPPGTWLLMPKVPWENWNSHRNTWKFWNQTKTLLILYKSFCNFFYSLETVCWRVFWIWIKRLKCHIVEEMEVAIKVVYFETALEQVWFRWIVLEILVHLTSFSTLLDGLIYLPETRYWRPHPVQTWHGCHAGFAACFFSLHYLFLE